jgi:hypothetical protein
MNVITVVVIVEGGNVQSIYSDENEKHFNVIMLDYDNFKAGQKKDKIHLLAEEMIENKQLNCIY